MNSRKFTKAQLWKGTLAFLWAIAFLVIVSIGHSAEPINPLLREFPITVDPTALIPPTSWNVPGITPLIYNMDPISSEALKTTEAKELHLIFVSIFRSTGTG